ncbi:acetyltransferase [Arthrobacter sp. H20]|uniref:acetyltransferase n=1 Tax=Arthrobacter sp. H20 TaxID=1267981 RepID=UPI00138AC1A0
MIPLLLIGASGLAREVISSLRGTDTYDVVGVLDDEEHLLKTDLDGVSILGLVSDAGLYPRAQFLVCASSRTARRRGVEALCDVGVTADRYATVIDRSVRVPPGCCVGTGSIVLAHVVMTTAVSIGHHAVVMPRVSLAYDDILEDFSMLAAGTALGGQVHVGREAYLGMNSSVRGGVLIGAGASVDMGAAVLEDVPAGERWGGVPAAPVSRGARTGFDRLRGGIGSSSAFERLVMSASFRTQGNELGAISSKSDGRTYVHNQPYLGEVS